MSDIANPADRPLYTDTGSPQRRPLYTDDHALGPSGRRIPSDPDALLDEAETAFLIKQSPRTLQAWRLRGGGPPYIKTGKRRGVRYHRGTTVQWYLARMRNSTSDSP